MDDSALTRGEVLDVVTRRLKVARMIPDLPERFVPSRDVDVVEHGDCLRLMEKIEDRSVALVLCDLPYGLTRNAWDQPIPMTRLWDHYRRIVRPDGVIALTAYGMFGARLQIAGEDLYRYTAIWKKNKPTGHLNARRQPLRIHESIHVFYDRRPVYQPQFTTGHKPRHSSSSKHGVAKGSVGTNYSHYKRVNDELGGSTSRYPTDVIEIPIVNNDSPKKKHPTEKPVELGEWFVKTYTQPGDLVVDNACGSGAFLVAAAKNGRRYWGCDLQKRFVNVARKRLAKVSQ